MSIVREHTANFCPYHSQIFILLQIFHSVPVKECWKSVYIWWSYQQEFAAWLLFGPPYALYSRMTAYRHGVTGRLNMIVAIVYQIWSDRINVNVVGYAKRVACFGLIHCRLTAYSLCYVPGCETLGILYSGWVRTLGIRGVCGVASRLVALTRDWLVGKTHLLLINTDY